MRHDGRQVNDLRKITIQTNVFKHPEGSVVISFEIHKSFVLRQLKKTCHHFYVVAKRVG